MTAWTPNFPSTPVVTRANVVEYGEMNPQSKEAMIGLAGPVVPAAPLVALALVLLQLRRGAVVAK